MDIFVGGLLEQVQSILTLNGCAVYCHSFNFNPYIDNPFSKHTMASGTCKHIDSNLNKPLGEIKNCIVLNKINSIHQKNKETQLFFDDECALFIYTKGAYNSFIYLGVDSELNEVDKHLVSSFCNYIVTAYSNIIEDFVV
jgi:hypothetical protein